MSSGDPADQAARARLQAEHRAIIQATMQAKRAGKLPAKQSSGTADAITAVVVILAVFAVLALAFKFGN